MVDKTKDEITFKRGEFREYRATIKVHLGQIVRDIFEDEVIEFDGQSFKHNGESFVLPTLRAAVKKGWLVPAEDETSVYVPQPAGVEVRPALNTGSKEKIKIETVDDEERVVGTLAGASIGGRPAATTSIGGAETGEVVGTVKSPAKGKTIIKDAASAASQISRIGSKRRVAASNRVEAAKPKAKPKAKSKAPAKKATSTKDRPTEVDLGDGYVWSLQGHWRERVKKAREITTPDLLRKIQDVETAQGVKTALEKMITRLEA